MFMFFLCPPVLYFIEKVHNTLPVVCKIQYQQHQNHDGRNIEVQILKRVKHQRQIEEEEDNRDITSIQFAILVPMK